MTALKNLRAATAFWRPSDQVRIRLYLDEEFFLRKPDFDFTVDLSDQFTANFRDFEIVLMGTTLTISDTDTEVTFPPFAAPYITEEIGLESRMVFADTHEMWVTGRGRKAQTDLFQPLTEIEIFRMTRGY